MCHSREGEDGALMSWDRGHDVAGAQPMIENAKASEKTNTYESERRLTFVSVPAQVCVCVFRVCVCVCVYR